MTRASAADFILRAGLAFAFIYPPINALFDPDAWIGYFPQFTRGFVDDLVLLHTFGTLEVVIALWLLSGRHVFWPAAAAFLMLVSIVALDFSEFQIVFRDLSIAAIALYLCMKNYPLRTSTV